MEKLEKLERIVIEDIDPFLALITLMVDPKLRDKAEELRNKYSNLVDWEKEYIDEAEEKDIGHLCKFWDDGRESVGILSRIADSENDKYYMAYAGCWAHCRRLNNDELEELL